MDLVVRRKACRSGRRCRDKTLDIRRASRILGDGRAACQAPFVSFFAGAPPAAVRSAGRLPLPEDDPCGRRGNERGRGPLLPAPECPPRPRVPSHLGGRALPRRGPRVRWLAEMRNTRSSGPEKKPAAPGRAPRGEVGVGGKCSPSGSSPSGHARESRRDALKGLLRRLIALIRGLAHPLEPGGCVRLNA